MGCNTSKQVEAGAVHVYRPPPSSVAAFDITSIKEPWLELDNKPGQNQHQEKPSHVPPPILEKLNKLETGDPRSWEEVSKALQDLKKPQKKEIITPTPPIEKKEETPIRKNTSFHTLEELDAKLSKKPEKKETRKTESTRPELKKLAFESTELPAAESGGGGVIKPVKDNIFIMRDRLERAKEGKVQVVKRDPLSDFPEKCPPDGADSVVIYTTSLRGVRRTFEDCTRVRAILEGHHVVFDERDVSLDGGFLREMKELVAEEGGESSMSVPRVFVKGRYIGGAEEVVELNEEGRFGRILTWARVERAVGREACGGCGDARFVPCLECGGSCKVAVDGVKERCGDCNENGLVRCPTCH